MRLGKFPNLISYGIFCPQIPVRRPSLPVYFVCLAYLLCVYDNVNRVSVVRQHCSRHKRPLSFFPFVVGCRGGRFRLQRLFRLGLSDARFMGRILPEVWGWRLFPWRRSRLTLLPTPKPHAIFASENGNGCSGCCKWKFSLSPFPCRVDDRWKSVELMNRIYMILIFTIITAQQLLNKVLTKREKASVPACRSQQPISIVEFLLRMYIANYQIFNTCIQQFIRITVYLSAEMVAHVSCVGTY